MSAPAIGRSVPRKEARQKVTGRARYVDDLTLPGMLHGVTVRSAVPRGLLRDIDFERGFPWDEVTIVTADDIPGTNRVALIVDDQPYLASDTINHPEEPVVLLAHADRHVLEEARRRVKLVIEPLPPVLAMQDAIDRREVIWGDDNVFKSYLVARGNVEEAFRHAHRIVEGEYETGAQEQLYIEPNGMLAVADPESGVTVWGSMQCPYYIHRALVRLFNLSSERIRVVQMETGGGFGGKEEYPSIIAIHAALLARACRKPVRMIYDRHEDIAATTKRHPAVVTHRTGMRRDGTLVAQDIEVVMDGGAYCTLTPVVLSRGALHAGGPYRCPNVRIRSRATRTNTPPNGAFRGFGAPQTEFAAETHLNRLADVAGLSPLEIRRRNVYVLGDTTPTGQVLRHSVAGEEVLERAAEAAEFDRMRERTADARVAGSSDGAPYRTGLARRAPGVGIALAWHGAGFTGSGEVKLASVAAVELTGDGRIEILTGSTEMGQGTKTIFPQLVADALGVAYEDVEIAPQDTALVPDSGPTVASRTAMVVGGLLIKASQRLRTTVEDAMAGSFGDTYRAYAASHGPLRIDQRFEPYPDVSFDDETYRGDAYPAFGWASCVAHVEVDLDTGEVTVIDVVAADDVGKVIHPVLAEGQVEGGTLQAVGYATIEEMKVRDGRYVNDRLATYLIPTALDAPRITAILVEAPFPDAPHLAKGVGELPMDVGAPAVVAAIHDATGVWIHDLPATPEKILAAIHGAGAGSVNDGATEAAIDAPIAAGPDPRPDAPTDPLPLRGVQPDGDEPTGEPPSDAPWDGSAR